MTQGFCLCCFDTKFLSLGFTANMIKWLLLEITLWRIKTMTHIEIDGNCDNVITELLEQGDFIQSLDDLHILVITNPQLKQAFCFTCKDRIVLESQIKARHIRKITLKF